MEEVLAAATPEKIINATVGMGASRDMAEIYIQIMVWVVIAFVQTIVFSVLGTWWVRNLIDGIRDEMRLLIDGIRTEVRTLVDGLRLDIRSERKEIDLAIANVENEFRDRIDALARELSQKTESSHSIHDRELAKLRDDLHQLGYHVRDTYAKRESVKGMAEDIKSVFEHGLKAIESAVRAK